MAASRLAQGTALILLFFRGDDDDDDDYGNKIC